jgi:hypothetical protein
MLLDVGKMFSHKRWLIIIFMETLVNYLITHLDAPRRGAMFSHKHWSPEAHAEALSEHDMSIFHRGSSFIRNIL